MTDTERIDLIERLGPNAPHTGADGKTWYVTAYGNRECWGKGNTLRECLDQVAKALSPEIPDCGFSGRRS
jgi:hypothetical protein